jgi:tetratricopeptide (TPR) repeat protein
MDTKLRAWCVGVVEAAVLVAVTSVPLFVNFYGFRVFELSKGSLVVALALLAALAGIVALIEGRFGGVLRVLRQPLVVAALLMWSAMVLATVFSVVPRSSLLGSQERAQGLLALSAALVMFGAAAGAARGRNRRARIVGALIGGSVPVALYALTQAVGIVAVPGKVESTARAFGTLSNPIFLGAYLMLIVPVTVAAAAAALSERRTLTGVGLALVAILQLAGLAVSASRGPGLGLAAGLLVLLLAWGAIRGRREVAVAAIAAAVAGAVFLVVLNMPSSPLAPLAGVPFLGRYAEIGEVNEGSQETRLLVWQAVDRLVNETDAPRLVVGYGPETLKYVLLAHTGPNVGGKGQSDRLVDRAHSVPLDDLVTTGLLGAMARLFVFGAWLFTASRTLGLAPTRRRRRILAAALAIGGAAGLATLLVPSLSPYSGALAALGLLAGLLVFLVGIALKGGRDTANDALEPGATAADGANAAAGRGAGEPGGRAAPAKSGSPLGDPSTVGTGIGSDRALAAGLLAAGAAAVAEASVGIETVAPQLVFWVLAGLVVAMALPTGNGDQAAERRRRPERSDDGEGVVTLSWTPGGAALGIACGGAMGILLYEFLAFGPVRLPETMPVLVMLVVSTWLAGLLAAATAREALSATGLSALAAFIVYTALRAGVLSISGDAAVLYAATVLWLIVLGLVAGWWIRERYVRAPLVSGAVAVAYPLLAIVAGVGVVTLAVRPVQADIYFQSALVNFEAARGVVDEQQLEYARERYADAETLFERAARLNPGEDTYPLKRAEAYTFLMSLSPDVETQLHWFQRAQTEIGRARDLDPSMPYHPFNHGHMQLVLAQMIGDEERRTRLASDAEINLQLAFDAVPYDPHVANELALAKLLQGDSVSGVALLEYVRDNLDDENALTWQLLARAYATAGRTDEAGTALERAMELGGGSPEDLVALGDAARQIDDLAAAAQWYERAVTAGARNWAVFYNLGLLYRDLGRTQEAMEALNGAVQLAPSEEERAQAQNAIQRLLEDSAGLP